MKFIAISILIILFISCINADKANNMSASPAMVTAGYDSIHPLLEIGGCYVYEIEKDTIAGLVVVAIEKEEDSIYYSFMLSGRFFINIPSEKEFRQAGLCGLLVPYYSQQNMQKTFARYFISENRLKPCIDKFKMVGKINLSEKNVYGSVSPLKKLEELSDEFTSFEMQNARREEEIKATGLPTSQYSVIEWKYLIETSDPGEMVKPKVVWILSPKTSHPKAAALMKEDWWWNPADDFSPFGNDDGADAFHTFKDWRANNPGADPMVFISELERQWAMSFSHIDNDTEEDLPSIEKSNWLYRNIDRAIIGIALGQIVLEGKISSKLRKLGIKAINRTRTEFGMRGIIEEGKSEYRMRLDKMEHVLISL